MQDLQKFGISLPFQMLVYAHTDIILVKTVLSITLQTYSPASFYNKHTLLPASLTLLGLQENKRSMKTKVSQ